MPLWHLVLVMLLYATLGAASRHLYKSNETEQYTSSTSYQPALVFSFTTNSDNDDFIISWTAEIYASNLVESVDVRLVCDGVTLNQQDWHPNPDGPTGDGWAVATGWKYADLNAGEHTFTIEYRSTTLLQQVGIRRTRVMATPANVVMV